MSPEIRQLLQYYRGTITALCIPSTICLITHFYKFITSPKPQSLPTKNLTFYCFLLFTFHIILLSHLNGFKPILPYGFIIMTYLMLSTTSFKFIIALDICWCFRQIALYLQSPSGPQNTKFFIYCFLGGGVPFLYTFLSLFIHSNKHVEFLCKTLTWAMRITRIVRLIPIIGSFWYMSLASIDKTELWTRFSLHIRLLVMLGGFSAVLGVLELISCEFHGEVDEKNIFRNSDWIYFFVQFIGAVLEGLTIGIFFTFRKDTFKPISSQ